MSSFLIDLDTGVFADNVDAISEYRSAIFTNSSSQLETAQRVTREVQAKHFTSKGQKIVTEIVSVSICHVCSGFLKVLVPY